MKNVWRKYWLIIGAIVCTLLMISSATAINAVDTKHLKESAEIENNQENEEVYIDPHLHLTKKHLPILKRSIQQMKDDQYKEVVQGIIDLLEKKGSVDDEDVRHIIDENDARITRVHSSGFIFGDGTGFAGTFPFTIIKQFLPLIWLPTLVVFWMVEDYEYQYYAQIQINFVTYDEHSHTGGIGVGFVGGALGRVQIGGNHIWNTFTVFGLSLLVFVY